MTMWSKKSLALVNLAAGLLVAGVLSASATPIRYTMDNGGTAFAMPGNDGAVLLDDHAGWNVAVTITLAMGSNFVTTGNDNSHMLFGFSLTSAQGAIETCSSASAGQTVDLLFFWLLMLRSPAATC